MQLTNTNTNERKLNRGGLTHVPSPPGRGALIAVILVLSMSTLLSYTLLDWGWQQDLGHKNYWLAGGGLFLFAFMLRAWRNDPRRAFAVDEPRR